MSCSNSCRQYDSLQEEVETIFLDVEENVFAPSTVFFEDFSSLYSIKLLSSSPPCTLFEWDQKDLLTFTPFLVHFLQIAVTVPFMFVSSGITWKDVPSRRDCRSATRVISYRWESDSSSKRRVFSTRRKEVSFFLNFIWYNTYYIYTVLN